MPSNLRVQFVHDWLTSLRGGEKVLLELIQLFPNSKIATLLHIPNATHPDIDSRVTQTSFLQNRRNIANNYRNYLPLFPRAIRSLQISPDIDLLISISHAVAKGITIPPGIPHLCYCNTPMRYIWGMQDQYFPPGKSNFLKRLALAAIKPSLRKFDTQNQNVTQFVANSQTVSARIKDAYHRSSTVIHPGIDPALYTLPTAAKTPRENFFLIVSALVPYKRVDLAIQTFVDLPLQKLIIIGSGPEEKKLKLLAKDAPNITFLDQQPEGVLISHYQRCRAFLFPGEEDFGLTPIEAQACGAPVIAFNAGGATETVTPQTGIFFNEQTPTALRFAIGKFSSATFNTQLLRQNALRFTWQNFRRQILPIIANLVPNSL